jgi:hypothetical protein
MCESSREAMRRRVLALGSAAALILGACSSSSHRVAPATSSTVPSTTAITQAAAPNPDVIPAVITPAYLDAVLVVLNHVYGDATRALRISHAITPQVKENLRSIFAEPLYDQQIQAATLSLKGPIANVRRNSGDGTTVVVHLISASPYCVFMQTSTDLSQVLVHPTPKAASEYYELAPKDARNDPTRLNTTPWVFAYNSAFLKPTSVQNPCVGSH